MSKLDLRERDLVKCEDMRIYAERSQKYLGSFTLDQFLANDLVQAAVNRCLEIIGEASGLVSEKTRLRSKEIPWQRIAGMCNVHEYDVIEPRKVYETVTKHIPALIPQMNPLIRALEEEVGWGG